jgi:hypothetical protein
LNPTVSVRSTGKPFSIAVIENLHDLSFLVDEAEISLVHDQRSVEGIENAEECLNYYIPLLN